MALVRLLAELPAPVRHVGAVQGGAAAVVCEDGACYVVPVHLEQLPWLKPVGRLQGPIAGAGGWPGDVRFVAESGHFLRVDPRTLAASEGELGPCSTWQPAAAHVSARVVGAGALNATYRSDLIEVWDEARGVRRAVHAPDSRDCFEIDAVAISGAGDVVAYSGLDVVYSSDGDWSSGQDERLRAFSVASGQPLADVRCGQTDRPSDHVPHPVALSEGACWVDGHRQPLLPEATPSEAQEDAAWYGAVTHLVAPAGDLIVVSLAGRAEASELLVLNSGRSGTWEGILARVRLPSDLAALAALGDGVIAGTVDGRVFNVSGLTR